MSRTISFSVSEEVYAKGEEFGRALNMGNTPCSRLASLAFALTLNAPDIVRPGLIPPIIVRPTSQEQRDEYEAYSKVKGYASLAAFALHAMELVISKNKLTKAQARRMDETTRNIAR